MLSVDYLYRPIKDNGISGIGIIRIIRIGNRLSVSLKSVSVSVLKYRPEPYRSFSSAFRFCFDMLISLDLKKAFF